MKKLLTLLMALALVLSLSVTAFADGTTNLTINSSDTTARTYNGYQLLNLTTSLKCNHAEDATHEDDCYNYAYTVNEKYRAILQAETLANYAWEEGKTPANAAAVTDAQILDYLGTLKSDNEGGTLRPVADSIYRAIKAANIDAEDSAKNMSSTGTIGQGYWLFADVTNLSGDEAANSLVMVDTKGQDALTINTKIALPTIEKKVKDTNDSEGTTTDWQDSADHDINDTVYFKLTATLPNNLENYTSYKLVFHDDLSDGLTLDTDSIAVYMYANKEAAGAGTNGTVVTGKFDIKNNNQTDGCTFEIGCTNVKAIEGVTKDTVFVVTYSAELNENAVIGAAGNPNEVFLEFSNNPYSDGTGKTEKDKVIVFTYQLTINKTDAAGNALQGAGFTLYKWYETTPAVEDDPATEEDETAAAIGEWKDVGNELKGDDMTTFNWVGLDDGDYKLKETTVPDGYNKMADIEFTITAEHDEKADDPKLTSLESTLGEALTEKDDNGNDILTGVIEEDIENNTGTVLPETGAKGTMMLITTSTILVVIAAVFMITRKKMSIYED